MMSSTPSANKFLISASVKSSLGLRPSECVIVHTRSRKRGKIRYGVCSNHAESPQTAVLGLSDFEDNSRNCCFSSIKSRLKEECDTLESKILEFMKRSRNRKAFPTRKQLIDAGRIDLVNAIMKQGGWLTLGWDMDDIVSGFPVLLPQRRINGSSSSSNGVVISATTHAVPDEIFPSLSDSSHLASSSDRAISQEVGTNGETQGHVDMTEDGNPSSRIDSTRQPDSTGRSGDPQSKIPIPANKFEESTSLESWRMWSLHRVRQSSLEFEVGEIHSTNGASESVKDISYGAKKELGFSLSNEKLDMNHIHRHLGCMETELRHIFHALKLGGNEADPHCIENLQVDDIHVAFRSIHVKIAVLQAKMALAIIDMQKAKDRRQKKMKNALNELERLRNVHIVWCNSASEVLLAGSYDGWISQRKMERGSSGIFRLYLKLYPGRYEVKFIVNGVWTTDPSQPVTRNDGFENNLLIIT